MIKSEIAEWTTAEDTLSETVYTAEKQPDSINAILGVENLNKENL